MSDNRHFKCNKCGHEWGVPYGTGLSGLQMECPKCENDDIHRTDFSREGQGRGQCSHSRGKSPNRQSDNSD